MTAFFADVGFAWFDGHLLFQIPSPIFGGLHENNRRAFVLPSGHIIMRYSFDWHVGCFFVFFFFVLCCLACFRKCCYHISVSLQCLCSMILGCFSVSTIHFCGQTIG